MSIINVSTKWLKIRDDIENVSIVEIMSFFNEQCPDFKIIINKIKGYVMEKKNQYVCPEGHSTVTIEHDEGTTPFLIKCTKCTCMAMSRFYRVDREAKPTHEWYKPDIMTVKPYEKEYVLNGGLLLRPIKETK